MGSHFDRDTLRGQRNLKDDMGIGHGLKKRWHPLLLDWPNPVGEKPICQIVPIADTLVLL